MTRKSLIAGGAVIVAIVAVLALRGHKSTEPAKHAPTPTSVDTVDAPGGPVRARVPTGPVAREVPRELPAVTTVSASDAPSVVPDPTAPVQVPTPREAAFQKRIGDYLLNVVTPRVRDCWRKLPGQGTIWLKYSYVYRDGRAYPAASEQDDGPVVIDDTEPTELTEEQIAMAIDCMSAAVDGTSFELKPLDESSTALTFFQDWHVGGK